MNPEAGLVERVEMADFLADLESPANPAVREEELEVQVEMVAVQLDLGVPEIQVALEVLASRPHPRSLQPRSLPA